MALAQRLNELAIANSQGLLNDDEYRLLRQSVFEQHSANLPPPVEAPLVPVARLHLKLRSSKLQLNHAYPGSAAAPAPAPQSHKPHPEQTKPPPPPTPRAKTSVVSLLRRATGRKTPASTPTPAPAPIHVSPSLRKGGGNSTLPLLASSPAPPPTPSTSKRSALIPRMLHMKAPEIPPSRTPSSSRAPPVLTHARGELHSIAYPPPSSPSSSNFSGSLLSQTAPDTPFAAVRDVFDDDNLFTARDIRAALASTEDEVRRLADAFANLEAATLRRVQKQRARRLPAPIAVLREHRLAPAPSSPRLASTSSRAPTTSDAGSTRSGSSARTSLSQARSIPALPRHPPPSPLSPRFHMPSLPLLRKNSLSSISSHTSSLAPSTAPSGRALARSASHLGLRRGAREASTDTLAAGARPPDPAQRALEGDDDAELADIRRRREALVARYAARIEFLRAKLRGAELHEKLLRK